MPKDFSALKQKTGISFANEQLMEQVFIHRSYLNEHEESELGSNERLEFLGDAVLELVVTERLFTEYPEKDEGELTAIRSAVVRREHLAKIAKELDLGQYLSLSKGEEQSGGSQKDYILANTLEALIGGLYVEQGYEVAKLFVEAHMLMELHRIVEDKLFVDNKSKFQELAQERLAITPHYQLVEEIGPDHEKQFVMGVFLGSDKIAEGSGTSKRKAEEEAANKALAVKQWE